MGVVTVITSGKGGVGKSTLTTGLGLALVRRGRRVLLMDGDAGLSSLDHMLGVSERQVFNIADMAAGEADPSQAIYPCEWAEGLFLLPAPGREEDIVSPEIMKRMVSVLSRYYDHVLIDCPAGVGSGFMSAVASAQRALVVSTPDPVCLRDCNKTRIALEYAGVRSQRLVVNRFSGKSFRNLGAYRDLDAVIDASGIRLIAIVPEDAALAVAGASGSPAPLKSAGTMALGRLAARLEGEQVPLAVRV